MMFNVYYFDLITGIQLTIVLQSYFMACKKVLLTRLRKCKKKNDRNREMEPSSSPQTTRIAHGHHRTSLYGRLANPRVSQVPDPINEFFPPNNMWSKF